MTNLATYLIFSQLLPFRVIYTNPKIYSRVATFQTFLKWVEFVSAGFFMLTIFWLFYTAFCGSEICQEVSFTQIQLIHSVQIVLPFAALINSLRIGTVFLLNDRDKDPETLFYLSLVGLVFSYSIFGWFFPSFLYRGENYLTDSPIFLAQIIVLLITVSLLLADRQTWDKSSPFVRLRISLSLIHLVLFLINPIIGLLASLLIVPVAVISYSGSEVDPIHDQDDEDQENMHS